MNRKQWQQCGATDYPGWYTKAWITALVHHLELMGIVTEQPTLGPTGIPIWDIFRALLIFRGVISGQAGVGIVWKASAHSHVKVQQSVVLPHQVIQKYTSCKPFFNSSIVANLSHCQTVDLGYPALPHSNRELQSCCSGGIALGRGHTGSALGLTSYR